MKASTTHPMRALVGATLATVLLVQPATAQDSEPVLEEIIVTAAYREQGLMDVPVSVSAVTGEMILDTGIQKAEDVQFLVPNFSITETGIATNVFIRGIGSGINQGFEQSVGTYIDGIYYGRAQMIRAPFLDLERVEVLRGPQSILFGKNSVAGALNISTASPTDIFEGNFLISNEFEHNETIIEGVLSGPLADGLRGRVAARMRNLDGYMSNATLNRDEPEREDWSVRAQLEWDVSDTLMATLKAEVGEFDVTGRHIEIINELPAAAGPFTGLQYNQILQAVFGADPSVGNIVQDEIRSSNGDFSNNETSTFALTLDWALGDYELKSITGYTDFEYDEFCDCDFTGASVFGAALQEKYEQFSQEFRLSSPLGETFDWIAGVYYQTSDHEYFDQIIVPTDSILVPAINLSSPGAGDLVAGTQAAREANVDNDVISGFAQFNWNMSDTWTLQVGGRVTNDQRDGDRNLVILAEDFSALPAAQVAAPVVYANAFAISSANLAALGPTGDFFIAALGSHPVDGSRDETKFSPEVKLVWNASDDAMLYGSFARGFKSGSFDFRANNRNFYPDMPTSFEFDDEENTNWELGGKFSLGDTAELNVAVFFTDFEELQISIFDGVLGFNVGNAAKAEVVGLELDGRWAPAEWLMISGGLAWTDFEFTDFQNGQCYFGRAPDIDLDGDGTPELCDYTGESNQLVSDVQGNLNFDFVWPVGTDLELRALYNLFYTSEYDASATFDPKLVQKGYSMHNIRVGLGAESGRWEVAILGRNLSDEKVLQFGGDTPLAGSTFGAGSNYAFYGRGRQVTLQALLRF
ncbi:MAG: TonB-dependent receptor [Gammaproteobacteria bacterium]|nr:TonB-dependent receptor [Gammaproteobacteria bacterium]